MSDVRKAVLWLPLSQKRNRKIENYCAFDMTYMGIPALHMQPVAWEDIRTIVNVMQGHLNSWDNA